MESVSVSKGCFVYKNGATRAGKISKKSAKRSDITTPSSILGKEFTEQAFYKVYKETWRKLEHDIQSLQEHSNACTLDQLVNFVINESKCSGDANNTDVEDILPTAVLLTGINQPDHLTQFETLSTQICEKTSANVCMLQSRDCTSLKAAVENLVYNFIEAPYDADEDQDRDHKRLRRSQYTLKVLKSWYSNNFMNADEEMECEGENLEKKTAQRSHSLIIILPDFECFNSIVLQDLILLLSSQRAQLPFCLILGVATAISAVHNTLPYHVTSRIKLCIAKMQSAPIALNEMLDKVILSPRYTFHLSGKALKFLTHIFLYYDFSINGFIQGYKYCMLEHFFQGNAYALCTSYRSSLTKIQTMTHDDIENIRRLLSFRPYVESINDCKRVIAILTDDDYLKKKLPHMLHDCHVYFTLFRTFLEFLMVLVEDLPKCPLGKYRREIYEFCLSKDVLTQPEFKECWQMLSFMSKDEFVSKVSKAIKSTEQFFENEVSTLEIAADCKKVVYHLLDVVKEHLTKVVMAGMEVSAKMSKNTTDAKMQDEQFSSRKDLKEKLLEMSKKEKPVSEFTKQVQETLGFIESEIIASNLKPLQRAPPLNELFFFSDIAGVRRNLIGAPRAALHMALNNPSFYLQCKCCQLDDEQTQLLPSMPDLSVAYKLHLECGRMINLFDWLQAFRAIVSDENDESNENERAIDPEIQARFTRAVAELQFLGYIKMSKRKTDHAMRLTW